MCDRCTNRVVVTVWNQEIDVCAIRAERVVAGEFQFLAGLPPAVDGGDDVRVERVVQLCFEFYSTCFGFEKNPFTFGNSIRFRRCRINFDERFGNRAAQAGDVAVLFVAEVDVSKKG